MCAFLRAFRKYTVSISSIPGFTNPAVENGNGLRTPDENERHSHARNQGNGGEEDSGSRTVNDQDSATDIRAMDSNSPSSRDIRRVRGRLRNMFRVPIVFFERHNETSLENRSFNIEKSDSTASGQTINKYKAVKEYAFTNKASCIEAFLPSPINRLTGSAYQRRILQ